MVKIQLKKVLCKGVAVGNLGMEDKQIFQNVQLSVNFLVSLLKKNWQNILLSLVSSCNFGRRQCMEMHLIVYVIFKFLRFANKSPLNGPNSAFGESQRNLGVEIGSADGYDDGGERQGSTDRLHLGGLQPA
ncbi:hypothetical protein MKW98_012727 [Papaver atlanticum]|uniref:Uncharacterized protein n=1 Tax=Papaver atlanticum TaxID=357466 RepID=A0AAD4SWC9_9MAGN|nr:hypothetical protein MKW98_012727 [Papaver atlanticum]